MRSSSRFPVLVLFGLLGLSGCGGQPDALNPSLAVTAPSCPLQLTVAPPATLTVAPNSTNNNSTWFIKNNGSSAVTLTSQTLPIPKAPVTTVRANSWITFPYSLAGGSQIDADLRFDVGASGSGTLGGLTIGTSPCGSQVLPSRPVVVSGACTIVTDTQNKPIQALVKPGYLQSGTDPAFGTKITRITGDPTASIPVVGGTWGNVARHRYSKEAAWNADQSLIALKRVDNDPTSHLFLDGSTYQVKFTGSPPPNARESETRWHPSLPDIMIYVTKTAPLIVGHWNVRGGYTAKVTLSGYTNGYFGPFEGNSSRDGRYIVVFATRSSDQKSVAFAVDLSTGQKFPDIDLVASGLEVTVNAGWASISASGNYVVLVGKKVADGSIHVSKVYNRVDGAFVKELPSNFVHYDLTLDAAGDDVGVGMKTGSGNYNFSTIRLRDGSLRDLDPSLMMGTSITHSSARNLARPGWAYMTVNNGPDPFQKEIFALKLDGSGAVERLAHHRSNVTVYDTEPHAVPSPDGKRVIFASNWGATPVHAFVVDVRPICP